MPSTLKQLLRTLIGFAIAGFFLYLAFRGTDFAALWASFASVNYFWVILLIPTTLLSHWIRALRWAYLLAPIKAKTSKRHLFSAVMIGYMVNNALPRVGELVRPYVIGKLEGISKSSALGTVVIERILDFVTFYLIVSIILFVYPSALGPFFGDVSLIRPLFLVSSIAFFLAFVVLFFKIGSLVRFGSKIKVFVPMKYHERLESILNSFVSGFAVSKMRESFLALVVLSFVMQGLYALGLYLPFFAFDSMARLNLDFGASVVLLVISSIAFVLPAPGGLGTYHAFMTASLVQLYSVDKPTAQAYSIVTHEIGYILVTVIGFYYLVKDHIRVSEMAVSAQDEGKLDKL
jgi:uncharacterized protein (TIRG00374 family)